MLWFISSSPSCTAQRYPLAPHSATRPVSCFLVEYVFGPRSRSEMQQRKSVAGRPSGTDGSDFSYRMLVDPRYTKVAQGKSRLRVLIIVQAFSLVIGMMWAALSALQEQALNTLSIVSVIIALVSLITGDLGRRRSSVNLLKLYIVSSSIATVLSVAHIVTSDLSFEALQDQNVPLLKKFEAVEAGRVLLGVLVQIFAIIITASLMQNMSPKRVS